ncbi:MAG: hypothetical protein ACR2ME_01520 [Acidimicrobiia bacterium]
MDLNLVLVKGRPVVEPEVVTFPDGVRLMRMMLAVRIEGPHPRLDVVPVIWWQPSELAMSNPPAKGESVWIIGAVQRRFLDVSDPPRSDVEIVAQHVVADPEEPALSSVIEP